MKKYIFVALALTIGFSGAAKVREISLRDIFRVQGAQSDEKLNQLNKRCKELNLALEFEKTPETGETRAIIEVRGLKLPIPQNLLEKLYHSLIKNHPYSTKTAHVRTVDTATGLVQEEQNFLAQRNIICQKAIEKLLDERVEPEHLPRVALCFSGGGFRSLFSTAGFLYGLDNNKILDAAHYIAGLSGSTWALAPWMLESCSFHDFYAELINRATNGFLHQDIKEHLKDLKVALPTIANCFLKKLIYKEIPSMIDIYGYTLALSLFTEKDMVNYLNIDLTAQIENIENGQRPFPIYTATIPYEDGENYAWLEFSPYEVASYELKSGVPNWGYGRKFKKGSSVTKAPPLTLGFLMGLYGSALSISLEELFNEIFDKLKPAALFQPLKTIVQSSPIGDLRLFPAKIRNYTYQVNDLPKNKDKRAVVVDAGIDFSLPLPPLLNPQRAIDIIIICDASANPVEATELKKAEEYAQNNNLPFPKIDYTNITTQEYSIFDDGQDSDAPIVIYVPIIQSDEYCPDFNPQDHLELGDFLNTFNLKYSKEEALLLSGLFEHKANKVSNTIIDQIKTIVDRKRC